VTALALASAFVIGLVAGICVMIVWPMFDKPPGVAQLAQRRMDKAWDGDDSR
jgi:hypothetical protein